MRLIFELYATGKYGIRKISQELTRRGHTSLLGNEFNQLTIKHILTNPKYKGWYCGNKTQSLDYRTKKKAFLEESEWVMYPDSQYPGHCFGRVVGSGKCHLQAAEPRGSNKIYQLPQPLSIQREKSPAADTATSFHRQSFKTQKRGDGVLALQDLPPAGEGRVRSAGHPHP